MVSGEDTLSLSRARPFGPAWIGRLLASPRWTVYAACTGLALLTSYFLGKDMGWDTLDYHLYAGFSALHDRFGQDYFAAGSQSYFNPYAYAPFYLLAMSGLPALAVASMLAVVQSGILWLTYEIAAEVMPAEREPVRLALMLCAVALAFANPILINELGSSYADITTAEIVLGGWLLLVRALRRPGIAPILWGGALLGIASALKLTNSVHALSAAVVLLFVPVGWRTKLRHAAAFGMALGAGFVLVSAPWSLQLERHFGNPLFPLLNDVFRSPQYPIAKMLDYRFVPDSLAEALWRPFAIGVPRFDVDNELQSPDLRYAVLLVAVILLLLRHGWRRLRRSRVEKVPSDSVPSTRALAALGSGLLVDWILWLTASGNGRYFIAMACIAAVLVVAMVARLFAAPAKLRNYLLAAILGAQLLQLCFGADYRNYIPWAGGRWFDVKMPAEMARQPGLYLSYGMQTNSFIVPFLARRSGFVNIAGDYPLAPAGANGAAVESLIRRYAPHLWLVVPESWPRGDPHPVVGLGPANDALVAFRMRAHAGDCSTIAVVNEGSLDAGFITLASSPTGQAAPSTPTPATSSGAVITHYLAVCPLAPDSRDRPGLIASERRANLVLDRLEDACPALFQPARAVTQYYGEIHGSHVWARRYLNTNLTAWVSGGWVHFIDPVRAGPVADIGPEKAFEKTPVRISCGRRHERYYASALPASRR